MGDPTPDVDDAEVAGSLFVSIPDPTLRYTNGNGEPTVRAVNPAYEETFAVEGTDPVGQSLTDALSMTTTDESRYVEELAEHAAGSDVYTTTTRFDVGSDDRRFLLRLLPDDDGGFVLWTDVTERERRHEQLERRNERLEEFASVLAHDLRNPLEIANMWLEPARESGDTSHLDKVASAHDRIERTIDDLLTLARQGEVIEATEVVELDAVASDAWAMVDTGDARLVVEDGIGIEADPDRLQRLLENLFRNAVEHAGDAVTVTVGPLDDPSEPGFYVADDGTGIPREDRARVFEAGYSTTDDGTGLGLAIVKRIAEAHGWAVDVTASSDGGTELVFTGVRVG